MTDPNEAKTSPDGLLHTHRRARRPETQARLTRSSRQRVVAGVLGGIAEYVGANPLWVRVLFVLTILLTAGMIAVGYVLLWLLLPNAQD